MSSRISDVFQSYNSLASTMLDRWSRLGTRAASRIDAGAYRPSHAADDAAEGAALAAESAWMWTAWTWEAVARLAGLEGKPNIVQSETFKAQAGAALELAGPLVRGRGPEQLPVSCVSIDPPQLETGETDFKLRADGSGYSGGTYVGEVNATAGAKTKPVPVWITIP